MVQGLDIDIRAMVAAGAESVSNGGCHPDDTLHLTGDPAEDRSRLEKFLTRFHDAGDSDLPMHCPGPLPCLALQLGPALQFCLALGICPARQVCPAPCPALPAILAWLEHPPPPTHPPTPD